MNIILFGFMGTGKTTVGRILARRLNMKFVDMDALIEQREKRTISSIFETGGEAAFRRMEKELVRELAGEDGLVIATGGGVVLDPDNLAAFRRNGHCVCLWADPETILARTARKRHRPLLEQGPKEDRIRELVAQRTPFYDAIPLKISTVNRTPREIARLIEKECHALPCASERSDCEPAARKVTVHGLRLA